MRRVAGAVAVTLAVAGCGSTPTHVATVKTPDVEKLTADADAFREDAQRQIDEAEAAVAEAERVIAEQTAAQARRQATATAKARAARSSASRPRVGRAPTPAGGDIFDALARCESGMRQVTGGSYHSYFQWSLSTWHSLGFSGMPEDYDYATQKAAAQRLVARSGWGQFPVCSRKIGAR